MTEIIESTIVHPGELTEFPANSNTHPSGNIAELAESRRQFSQYKNAVVWSPPKEMTVTLANGKMAVLKPGIRYVLAGNGLHQASIKRGDAEIEVKDYSHLTYEQAVLLAEADNASSLGSAIDPAQMKENLERARALYVDNERMAGMLERAKRLAGENGAGLVEDVEPQIDRAEELRQRYGVELGQVWELGAHRLVCGDCTDRAVVGAVVSRDAAMCVTSPPYPGADMWSNDNEAPQDRIERLNNLNRQALQAVWNILGDGGIACWNIQDNPWGNHGVITTTTTTTTIAVKEIGYSIRGNIIWDKGVPHLPPPAFMRRPCVPNLTHEHILILFKGDWQPREKQSGLNGEEKKWLAQGVWRIGTESAKKIGHKAPFPIEIPGRCVSLFSLLDDLVFDPFLGSGTTIIACEQLNRRCRAVEINPGYVAVSIHRWHELTGLEPKLIT